MKLFIASDIHGSAYYCRQMIEAFKAEKADSDAAAEQEDQPVKKGRRSGKAREEEAEAEVEEAPEAE